MIKNALRKALEEGRALADAFPYKMPGQDCEICKFKPQLIFNNPDDIFYIPDFSLNEIEYEKSNLSKDEIDNIIGCCYTAGDFIREAFGNKRCAMELYRFVDWQHPDIQDLLDCTDEDEAKKLYGESWTEMKARLEKDHFQKGEKNDF